MPNPNSQIPLTQNELRKTTVRILDKTTDAHQTIAKATTDLDNIDSEIRQLRAICLRSLLPENSVADTIIPGIQAIYDAIDLTCDRAKAPHGCADLAKAAVFQAIWERLT